MSARDETKESGMPRPRLTLSELSGSLGDLGTFLPLTLALAVACDVPLAASFFVAGVAHLITARRYPIPIPVQPMKAIAALAIGGGLAADSIYLAGALMAAALLTLAITGGADRLQAWIPLALVRGLQLGLGALLAWRGFEWLAPGLAGDQMLWVSSALLLACLSLRWRFPSALIIVLGGLLLVWPQIRATGWAPWWPTPVAPDPSAWRDALTLATAQLPTTLLNSVVAVVVLSRDLFPNLPRSAVTARGLCVTMGGLNLFSAAFGGTPVCHGSGGLAAQYRFGARSNVALWILGGLKIALALAAGGTLAALVAVYPKSLLGVLVLISGLELIRVGLQDAGFRGRYVAALVAGGVLLQQTVAAVALGWLVHRVLTRTAGT
jgi:hypothetical protein